MKRKESFWNTYYNDIARYIRENYKPDGYIASKDTIKILEIGTAFGGCANYLLHHLSNRYILLSIYLSICIYIYVYICIFV